MHRNRRKPTCPTHKNWSAEGSVRNQRVLPTPKKEEAAQSKPSKRLGSRSSRAEPFAVVTRLSKKTRRRQQKPPRTGRCPQVRSLRRFSIDPTREAKGPVFEGENRGKGINPVLGVSNPARRVASPNYSGARSSLCEPLSKLSECLFCWGRGN